MVKALAWRIGLSVGLFVLLIVAYSLGWIDPRALRPPRTRLKDDRRLPRLQPVDEDKQSEPHHVDEVPVPGHRLEREMPARGEMALHHPEPDDGEHDGADRDMQAVEPGQHEERRAVDAGAELQAELGVGLVVLGRLQRDEREAQEEGRRQENLQARAVAGDQRVMRDRDGDAARSAGWRY